MHVKRILVLDRIASTIITLAVKDKDLSFMSYASQPTNLRVLRPTLCHLLSKTNTCKTTSALTRFVSDGDPPILKLEKEVGEQ